MRKENALRLAPARYGAQVANAWRLWVQGGEFCAAARDMARLGKVSFHSRFNWQLRAGTVVNRLAPPISLSNNWLPALEIAFLVDRDASSAHAARGQGHSHRDTRGA